MARKRASSLDMTGFGQLASALQEHVCIRLRLPLHATMFGFACEHDRIAFEVYIAPGRYCSNLVTLLMEYQEGNFSKLIALQKH